MQKKQEKLHTQIGNFMCKLEKKTFLGQNHKKICTFAKKVVSLHKFFMYFMVKYLIMWWCLAIGFCVFSSLIEMEQLKTPIFNHINHTGLLAEK